MSAPCLPLPVTLLLLSLTWILWQDLTGAVGCDAYLLLWEPLRTMFLRSSFPFLCLSALPPQYGMNLVILLPLPGEKLTPGIRVGINPNALSPPFVGGMK
jgi:hypothetical protein